jgi:hypothetical protein
MISIRVTPILEKTLRKIDLLSDRPTGIPELGSDDILVSKLSLQYHCIDN